jgi:hypothetical protein
MQQRQFRPGDVLDDYCPRERRITDHAIVAMVESEILRTRCVVCEAEHEFKNARLPAGRRKTPAAALFTQVLDTLEVPAGRLAAPPPPEPPPAVVPPPTVAAPQVASPTILDRPIDPPASDPLVPDPLPAAERADDRPFRRSLIRAQLPRHEGQVATTRVIPEFTMHQPPAAGKRPGQGRFRRRPPGAADTAGPMRFGRDQAQGRGAGQGNGAGNGAGAGQGARRRRRKKH